MVSSDYSCICGHFQVSVNPVLRVDQYPLPRMEHVEDIHVSVTLGRSKSFSKIDLPQAFLHLELKEDEILTVNTHTGLFRFNRLAFGVTSAPAIIQKYLDIILHGIPKTQGMQDSNFI